MAGGRPCRSRSLEREFWEQVPLWESFELAAEAVGVSYRVGKRWVAESGGVKPKLTEPVLRLSFRERCRIEDLLDAGWTQAKIARDLDRDPSTISREIARHRKARDGGYGAEHAQSLADADARRPKEAKLATNLRLRREVQDRLRLNHSPEQIVARLREDYPDDPEMWVSHETIYQSLYVQARGGLKRELAQHLRTGRSVRKPHRTAGQRRSRIPDLVGISERPPEVEDRAVPGHWEGDLILGSVDSASAIGTLVERACGFVMLLHLAENHGAVAVQNAMVDKMSQLPQVLRRTLTWDQGMEMANHVQIAAATDLDIYFCDPHSPWQRGSNENTNGLLRQYFPKGTDLSQWGPGYLDHVAAELNNRPRKRLAWRTPAEALEKLLWESSKTPGVAPTA
jgi:IS30 family transposase